MGIRYHDVEPSDTMLSICSKYGITARELRQANFGLSGSNVQGGPKRLIIPAAAGSSSDQAKSQPTPKQQRRQEHEENIGEADKDGESLHGRAKDNLQRSSIVKKIIDTTSDRRFSDMVRYHDVEPSETISSICSKYNITARELRQANFGLSGSNVQGGPKRLIIPAAAGSSSDQAKSQPTQSQEQEQEQPQDQHEEKKEEPQLLEEEGTDALAKDNLQRTSIVKKVIDTTSGRRFSEMVRYHDVDQSDTMSSICLKYGITARELRQANFGLSGSNVQGGPKRLIIPAAAGRTTAQAKPQPIPQQKQERQEHEEKIDEADGDGESLQRTSIVKKVFDTTSGRRFSEMVRYHDVDQSDTMSSICLKYGITARELRQANFGLSGSNVQGGPKRLIIPAPDPKSLFAH